MNKKALKIFNGSTLFTGIVLLIIGMVCLSSNSEGKMILGIGFLVAAGCCMGIPLASLITDKGYDAIHNNMTGGRGDGHVAEYSKIHALEQRGKYEDAMFAWGQLLMEFPGDGKAYMAMMDLCLRRLDDMGRAEEVVKRAKSDEAASEELIARLSTRVETVKSRKFLTDDDDDELD